MTEGQGFARRVTRENLEQFAPLLRKRDEADATSADEAQATSGESRSRDPELEAAESQFTGTSMSVPGPAATPSEPASDLDALPSDVEKGPLLWDKPLSNTDAQNPQEEGTNPKGELAFLLGKSSTPDKEAYEAQTWFREKAFASLDWQNVPSKPDQEEEAYTNFAVRIDDQDQDVFWLRLTHRKTRVSLRSHTYLATVLHWGQKLTRVLRTSNVQKGSLLELYAPPADQSEPFFIEIESSPDDG